MWLCVVCTVQCAVEAVGHCVADLAVPAAAPAAAPAADHWSAEDEAHLNSLVAAATEDSASLTLTGGRIDFADPNEPPKLFAKLTGMVLQGQSVTQPCDERVKEDVSPASPAAFAEALRHLTIVSFRYRADACAALGVDPTRDYVGVIAQNVPALLRPLLVRSRRVRLAHAVGPCDTVLTIDWSALVPVLALAYQYTQAQVDTLLARQGASMHELQRLVDNAVLFESAGFASSWGPGGVIPRGRYVQRHTFGAPLRESSVRVHRVIGGSGWCGPPRGSATIERVEGDSVFVQLHCGPCTRVDYRVTAAPRSAPLPATEPVVRYFAGRCTSHGPLGVLGRRCDVWHELDAGLRLRSFDFSLSVDGSLLTGPRADAYVAVVEACRVRVHAWCDGLSAVHWNVRAVCEEIMEQ